ncbi:MAG: hypothetical protein ACI9CF_000789 [Candidatus Omnitrophota bacterium]|jgi:hypothetical protein
MIVDVFCDEESSTGMVCCLSELCSHHIGESSSQSRVTGSMRSNEIKSKLSYCGGYGDYVGTDFNEVDSFEYRGERIRSYWACRCFALCSRPSGTHPKPVATEVADPRYSLGGFSLRILF